MRATKLALGWDPAAHFHVPREVYEAFDARPRGSRLQHAWEQRAARFTSEHARLAAEWRAALAGEVPAGLELPEFEPDAPVATRVAAGKVMQALASAVPTMIGGSADLAGSVGTRLKDQPDYTPQRAGRNIHWGVREHAMAAAINGLALHGGIVRPFGSTFLQFADYMRPAIRLSALMGLPVTWVFSHDSVGLGEDGPTHQPIEHLAALRAIPGLTVIRPADATETSVAWRTIIEALDGPACLVLSRQALPVLDRNLLASAEGVAAGAYVLAPGKDAIIVATGSEVPVALEARELLAAEGVQARVVSMPSWELFSSQDEAYRDSVLPAAVPSVSVEAGISQGWERWVDACVSIECYGASAPGSQVMARLGITPAAVAEAVRGLL